MDYDAFVDEMATRLDAEQPMTATGVAGASIGSLFRDAMLQVRAAFGEISWVRVFGVANAVVQMILAKKTLGEIIKEVVDLLTSGKL